MSSNAAVAIFSFIVVFPYLSRARPYLDTGACRQSYLTTGITTNKHDIKSM
jgi:hypothetical protein